MFVDERAESQAVPEGRGHVGDGHIPVAVALDPAPLLQRLHGRHPGARSRGARTDAGAPLEPSEERSGAAVDSPSCARPPPPPLSLLPLPSLSPPTANFRNFPQQPGQAGSRK